MNKRLKYKKYKGMDNILTIDLHNNYTVIALISKDNDVYDVQLMLKENTIDNWVLIEQAEHLKMFATSKNIYSVILKQVAAYLNGGFFNYYIERYKYEIKCFDLGNDIYEKNQNSKNFEWIKDSLLSLPEKLLTENIELKEELSKLFTKYENLLESK